jgi:GT2 family glycosyltransferase
MIKKEIFFELDGFDEKFFVSFEDVDLGWRANIFGYDVFLSPNSIVYHSGGETIKTIKKEIQFHGVKNFITIRLTNFEFFYSIRSLFVLFFVIFMRKFFKISVIKDPETSHPLPSFTTILSGFFWVIKNFKYVLKKRKEIKSKRIKSTNDLKKLGVITL